MSKVAYKGDGKALQNAELGKVYSMDTYMSQNAPDTLAETAGTATAYKVSAIAGAETVALSDVSAATGTIKKGDGFIVDGYLYRFMEDKTAVSGAVDSIKIDQPIHATLDKTVAYPIRTTHSLAFHRNGLALVTRKLELPMGTDKAAIMSANGLAIRVVFGYDQKSKTDTVSFDIIYGVKELDAALLVKFVG